MGTQRQGRYPAAVGKPWRGVVRGTPARTRAVWLPLLGPAHSAPGALSAQSCSRLCGAHPVGFLPCRNERRGAGPPVVLYACTPHPPDATPGPTRCPLPGAVTNLAQGLVFSSWGFMAVASLGIAVTYNMQVGCFFRSLGPAVLIVGSGLHSIFCLSGVFVATECLLCWCFFACCNACSV